MITHMYKNLFTLCLESLPHMLISLTSHVIVTLLDASLRLCLES